jgi:hypothetical protein
MAKDFDLPGDLKQFSDGVFVPRAAADRCPVGGTKW